jgi:hypothetical protein
MNISRFVALQLLGASARVVVAQRYSNTTGAPVAMATFRAYLADLGAVCGVSVQLDAHAPRIDAVLCERAGEADEREADDVHALNPERDHDLFACRIGPMRVGQTVCLSVTFVAELFFRGDFLRFVVPTTFAERVAGGDDVALVPADAPAIALELELDVHMACDIERITSVSHAAALSCSLRGTRAHISLRSTETLALDVVLAIQLAEPRRSFVAVEHSADRSSATLLATFFPQFSAPPMPIELVFLIDCSATVRGAPLQRAQDIMRLCLAQLPAGSFFNVVSFGGKVPA